MSRSISGRVATNKNQSNRKRRAEDHSVNPRMRFSLCLRGEIDIFRALQSFRSQLECPCDDKRDGKSNHDCKHNKAHCPIRNLEKWKNLCRDLNEQPSYDRIRDRDLVNIAPLQLDEEVIDLHYFPPVIFCTSASKRGSPRRSSRNGSPGRRNK